MEDLSDDISNRLLPATSLSAQRDEAAAKGTLTDFLLLNVPTFTQLGLGESTSRPK